MKLTITAAALAALSFTAVAAVPGGEAGAQQAGPTIIINNTGGEPPYSFEPAQLDAKAGETITVKNNDPSGVHSVTANDRSFAVDVPPNGTVTFTVSKAGSYPYKCQYHPDAHNPATLNVS